MRDKIIKRLLNIEKEENIKILYAIETGSRAWGIASTLSDYDIRYIYIRPRDFYLKLEKTNDMLETGLVDGLNINGCDISKVLKLLHSSNPSVLEWCQSKTVYIETDIFKKIKPVLLECYISKISFNYYHTMAERNYKAIVKDTYIAPKKYLYILHPLLSCKWILREGTIPPNDINELIDTQMSENLRQVCYEILDVKRNHVEIETIQVIPSLNKYILTTLTKLKGQTAKLQKKTKIEWDTLNQTFLQVLRHCE